MLTLSIIFFFKEPSPSSRALHKYEERDQKIIPFCSDSQVQALWGLWENLGVCGGQWLLQKPWVFLQPSPAPFPGSAHQEAHTVQDWLWTHHKTIYCYQDQDLCEEVSIWIGRKFHPLNKVIGIYGLTIIGIISQIPLFVSHVAEYIEW